MSLVRKGIILEQVGSGVRVTFPSGENRTVLCATLSGCGEEQDKIIIEAKRTVDYHNYTPGSIAR
jgi:hypothetical protein